jgi:hypothetical protein
VLNFYAVLRSQNRVITHVLVMWMHKTEREKKYTNNNYFKSCFNFTIKLTTTANKFQKEYNYAKLNAKSIVKPWFLFQFLICLAETTNNRMPYRYVNIHTISQFRLQFGIRIKIYGDLSCNIYTMRKNLESFWIYIGLKCCGQWLSTFSVCDKKKYLTNY